LACGLCAARAFSNGNKTCALDSAQPRCRVSWLLCLQGLDRARPGKEFDAFHDGDVLARRGRDAWQRHAVRAVLLCSAEGNLPAIPWPIFALAVAARVPLTSAPILGGYEACDIRRNASNEPGQIARRRCPSICLVRRQVCSYATCCTSPLCNKPSCCTCQQGERSEARGSAPGSP